VQAAPADLPTRERLIVALDVGTIEQARQLVNQLGESVTFYKVGLEVLMSGRYFELVDWLSEREKKIFADVKLFDVPQTVASAVRQLTQYPITFVTVHGNDAMLQAACHAKDRLKILAVTVLTSLDQRDMEDLGFRVDLREVVTSRARRALELGCDGVITSGLEIAAIRERVGQKLLVVVPGIRPGEHREPDDQKRTVNVREAFERGADYIVVGRPIRTAPDPRKAAEAIQAEIASIFY
jgi:orotidine-5'-phosphate decarboxylase